MGLPYMLPVLPGAATLFEWLLAAVLYAASWRWPRRSWLGRAGDSLAVAGMVTALVDIAWRTGIAALALAFARSSLVTGLAVAMLAVYAGLAAHRAERLSAFLLLALAIPAQAYAVGRLWWGAEVVPQDAFGLLWLIPGVLTGMAGAGALGVGAAAMSLAAAFEKAPDRWPVLQAAELPVLGQVAVHLALINLSMSLALILARAWWGLGQVASGGLAWLAVAWLLLAASARGLLPEGSSRRPWLALLVPAFAAAVGGLLTMVN
jgi:hypothetical protein